MPGEMTQDSKALFSQQGESSLEPYTQSCVPHNPVAPDHMRIDRKIAEACWLLAWMKPETWTLGSRRKPESKAQSACERHPTFSDLHAYVQANTSPHTSATTPQSHMYTLTDIHRYL